MSTNVEIAEQYRNSNDWTWQVMSLQLTTQWSAPITHLRTVSREPQLIQTHKTYHAQSSS